MWSKILNKRYKCGTDTIKEFNHKKNWWKVSIFLLKCYKIKLFLNVVYLFEHMSFNVCSVQLWSSAQPECLQMQLLSTLAFAWDKWKFCMCASPHPELLALSLWASFLQLQVLYIVNEEDRRRRGLLVLIYPEGSLGITINSQLLAHSTRLHRHCQFVPIREAGFWASAVRSRSGPTGESDPDRTGLDYTLISWGVDNST